MYIQHFHSTNDWTKVKKPVQQITLFVVVDVASAFAGIGYVLSDHTIKSYKFFWLANVQKERARKKEKRERAGERDKIFATVDMQTNGTVNKTVLTRTLHICTMMAVYSIFVQNEIPLQSLSEIDYKAYIITVHSRSDGYFYSWLCFTSFPSFYIC